jgi:murein DD-endopeptidase MepM/ murein hydrolase activator NlpD
VTTDPFANGGSFRLNLDQIHESRWAYPLPGSHVISPYGGRRNHSGVDVKTCPNDKILAAFDGVVTKASPFSGYGNCIVIRHAYGFETLYSHQSKNLVKVGQKVKAGQVIGLTGRTGRATTEHLHFEVKFKGRRLNPNVIFNHVAKCLRNVTLILTKSGGVTSKSN